MTGAREGAKDGTWLEHWKGPEKEHWSKKRLNMAGPLEKEGTRDIVRNTE